MGGSSDRLTNPRWAAEVLVIMPLKRPIKNSNLCLVRVAMTQDVAMQMAMSDAAMMVNMLMDQVCFEEQLLVAQDLVCGAIGNQSVRLI